jgi:electron transfer flavoprotein alpha/beta subunit
MLAALLGWPQGTFASKLAIEARTSASRARSMAGLQTVKPEGPAIVTTDLRLNEPRYASLPNIMKAKKKPIADKTPATTASTSRRGSRCQDHRAVRPQVGREGQDRRVSWSRN